MNTSPAELDTVGALDMAIAALRFARPASLNPKLEAAIAALEQLREQVTDGGGWCLDCQAEGRMEEIDE